MYDRRPATPRLTTSELQQRLVAEGLSAAEQDALATELSRRWAEELLPQNSWVELFQAFVKCES